MRASICCSLVMRSWDSSRRDWRKRVGGWGVTRDVMLVGLLFRVVDMGGGLLGCLGMVDLEEFGWGGLGK